MKFEYRKEKSDVLGIIYRPIVEIELINQEKKIAIPGILYFDTGADITLIPRSTGELLGLKVKEDQIKEISGVGGGIVPVIIKKLDISLSDYTFTARIAWSLIEDVPPLLGRIDVFKYFDISINEEKLFIEINLKKKYK